jgi:hypothetical protein
MRAAFLYLILAFGTYLCQSVLYPAVVVPELRIDLFLILVVHSSFSHRRSWTLVLALFLGLLMDLGLPVKGCFHPLIYLGIALIGSILWQNLNLHSRHYQAIFLGLCALLEGVCIWVLLELQGAEFTKAPYVLQILAWRALATGLVGPLLLSGLELIDQWLTSISKLRESQEA